MNSVDRVKELCKEYKIPVSRLEKELGFSNGYISQLRKGSFPASRLMQIADYFHVPVNYLLFGSECMDTNDENHNDISHDLEILKQKLNSQESTPVFYKKKALSKEDAIFFAGLIDLMIQRLQSSNNN